MASPYPTTEDALLDRAAPESGRTLFICSIYENERPLKGTAGLLDWRLRGFLSRFVIEGKIQGKQEEFIYVPIPYNGSLRHLLLLGLGENGASARTQNSRLLSKIRDVAQKLGFEKVAVSLSSFPFWNESDVLKGLSGISTEFTQ